MKNIILYLLIILFYSCHFFKSNENDKSFIVPIPDHLEVLNPQTVVSASNKQIIKMIFSPLFELKGNTSRPKIIESWEYDSIENKYILKIKNKIYFHNGRKLTVDDIIFSFHQWVGQESLDGHLLNCIDGVEEYREKKSQSIRGIKKISLNEFSISVKNTSSDLIQLLTMPRFVVFPEGFNNLEKKVFFKNPIGSGPFKIVSLTDKDAHFERFEDYFGKTPKIKKIEFKKMDYKLSLEQFNNKVINNLFFYSVEDINQIKRKDKIVLILPPTSTVALVIPLNNHFSEVFTNREQVALLAYKELQYLSPCFANASSENDLLPTGIIKKVNERSAVNNFSKHWPSNYHKEINLKKIDIYVTSDFWSRCFDPDLHSISAKNFNLIQGEINDLFEKFKNGELHYFIEEFTIKNADPMSVLQYFEPGGEEYLLSKDLPELRKMYSLLRSNTSRDVQLKIINDIMLYLKKEYLVVPLHYPKNTIVYSDDILYDGVLGIYRNTIDWESLGYK